MFVQITREGLVHSRVCAVGDVVEVDETKGKLLLQEKSGVSHSGPATVDTAPANPEPEPADEPDGEMTNGEKTSDTAPKTGKKPAK